MTEKQINFDLSTDDPIGSEFSYDPRINISDSSETSDVPSVVTIEEVNVDDRYKLGTDTICGYYRLASIDTAADQISATVVAGVSAHHDPVLDAWKEQKKTPHTESMESIKIDGELIDGQVRFSIDRSNRRIILELYLTTEPRTSPTVPMRKLTKDLLSQRQLFRSIPTEELLDPSVFDGYVVEQRLLTPQSPGAQDRASGSELNLRLVELLTNGEPDESLIKQAMDSEILRVATGAV